MNYGLGIVFQYVGGCVSFSEEGKDIYGMQHITGELATVLKTVAYAELQELKTLIIVYGYEGVEKLATGEWFANQPYNEEYQRMMVEA